MGNITVVLAVSAPRAMCHLITDVSLPVNNVLVSLEECIIR